MRRKIIIFLCFISLLARGANRTQIRLRDALTAALNNDNDWHKKLRSIFEDHPCQDIACVAQNMQLTVLSYNRLVSFIDAYCNAQILFEAMNNKDCWYAETCRVLQDLGLEKTRKMLYLIGLNNTALCKMLFTLARHGNNIWLNAGESLVYLFLLLKIAINEQLFDINEPIDNMEQCASKHDTVLHTAARFGNFEVVKWLIEDCGASVNHRNKQLYTPLHYAVFSGHVEIAKFLLSHGADKDVQSQRSRTSPTGPRNGGFVTPYSYVRDHGSPAMKALFEITL